MNKPLDDEQRSEYISLTRTQVKDLCQLGKSFVTGMSDTVSLVALDGSVAAIQSFEKFLEQDKVNVYMLGTAVIRILNRWFLFSLPKNKEEADLRDFIEIATKICPEKIFNYDPDDNTDYADAHKWWASVIKSKKTGA